MALNAQPHRPSVSERRGQRVAPLETNFNRPPALSHRPAVANRPRPDYANMDGEVANRIPLQPAKRQSSRTSLRSLFSGSRDKSSRKPARDATAKLGEINELPRSESRINPNESRITVAPSEDPLSPDFCHTPKTAQTTPTLVMSPTFPAAASAQNQHSTSSTAAGGGAVKSGDEKATPGSREMGWKPPPLFQAYPQSVKHGILPAPTISSDVILRVHAAGKGTGDSGVGNQAQQWEHTPEANNAVKKKREEKERKHTRSLSQIINKSEWTQKIYVVSTAGYILQYAGDGKYDRLPEKMLQLGPKSVAFASDAIPGKHWVLQVSQDPDADPIEETSHANSNSGSSRPLLARLGFQRSYTRRMTQSLLMVFNDPNEMSSWLLTVRAEIEARGGKKYVSERVFDDGMEHQLRPKTSVRNLVKRDPNRFSNIYLHPQNEDGNESALSRQSSFTSNNRQSIISSTTQTDLTVPVVSGNDLASGRFYASTTVPREVPRSPAMHNGFVASSPAVSAVPPSPLSDISQTPTPTPKNYQLVMSEQPPPPPPPHAAVVAEPPRSQSPFLRSASPPAPNFSVPSFSKRFAAKSSLSQIPPMQLQWDDHDHDNDHDHDHASQHYNSYDDGIGDDYNAFASFPSPPQSPQRSFSSMSRPDPNELYGGGVGGGYISRQSSLSQSQTQRPLRVSESHDSLAKTRPPRGSVSTANSTQRPSRPISIISGSDNSDLERERQEPVPPPPPPHQHQHTKISRRGSRGRSSKLYQNNSNTTANTNTNTPPAVSRRKSMPGLAAGPPALPPPTCPLPKIPSPVPDEDYPSPSSSVADLPARALSPPPKLGPAARQVLSERSESPGPRPGSRSGSRGLSSRNSIRPRYSSLGPRTVSSLGRHV